MARKLHFGPARVPSRESPEAAVEALVERGLSACEIDFEGGFWMSYEFAEQLGEIARAADVALSVHAPLAGFMGHAERGKKLNMAVGMLDHTAGIAKSAGAEVVVFHPGFLLGRAREEAIDSVVEQLGELRVRLEGKGRGRAVRDRGDGARARPRIGRGRDRDLAAPRLGAAGARLRAHARDLGRGLSVGRALPHCALGSRRGAREIGAVPHPLQRHPVREPQRDQASPVRRGNAASRAAAGTRWRVSSGLRR